MEGRIATRMSSCAFVAILGSLLCPCSLLAQVQVNTIVDGPGRGSIINSVGTAVNGPGVNTIGVIESHGGFCPNASFNIGGLTSTTDSHFHGTLNGTPDPFPFDCGHGRVLLGDLTSFLLPSNPLQPSPTNPLLTPRLSADHANLFLRLDDPIGLDVLLPNLGARPPTTPSQPTTGFQVFLDVPRERSTLSFPDLFRRTTIRRTRRQTGLFDLQVFPRQTPSASIFPFDGSNRTTPTPLILDVSPLTLGSDRPSSSTGRRTLRVELPKPRSDVRRRLDLIKNRYKGTGDIAGAATELYNLNVWYTETYDEPWFSWTVEQGKGLAYSSNEVDSFLTSREMSCFEFVHFSAWLASDQPTRTDEDGRVSVFWGLTDSGINTDTTQYLRNFPENLPRGGILTGVHRVDVWNNTAGYYHVSISIGGGNVIGLGSDGLIRENVGTFFGGCFPRAGYETVYIGNYGYDNLNPAPGSK